MFALMRLPAAAVITYLSVSGTMPPLSTGALSTETVVALAITALVYPTLRRVLS